MLFLAADNDLAKYVASHKVLVTPMHVWLELDSIAQLGFAPE